MSEAEVQVRLVDAEVVRVGLDDALVVLLPSPEPLQVANGVSLGSALARELERVGLGDRFVVLEADDVRVVVVERGFAERLS